ncbi:hypothetical protein [Thalassoroseus pseudoceratinae]|uniref:hypothetical protein n=1 Tax=Thalassoroseus pseudoceratinae TaxID=2713176 RepID=UPI00141DA007|nr:hypothetical protein [Thalassoroseus pseudoceratinae]
MELFQTLTDDQKALVGCVVALLTCGTLMSLSYYVGQMFRKNDTPEPAEPHILRFPNRVDTHEERPERKAA